MFTVIGSSSSGEAAASLPNGHAYLILSRAESTMVLQTGKEINELENSGFFTKGPTVFACNMGNNKYIVQVSPRDVRLLKGKEQQQLIQLDKQLGVTSPVVKASCADPHLLVLTADGDLLLLSLDFGARVPQLAVTKANLKGSPVTNICAYRDVSGLFTAEAVSKCS